MIPLLLIQIGNGAGAAPHLAEGLQYTMPLGRWHFTVSGEPMHYTFTGRLHYDA